MFLGALTIGCSAIVMEQDNQFKQQATCKEDIPTSTSEKEEWIKYLCARRFSARKWHKKKIGEKIKKLESKLDKKLPFSYSAFFAKWVDFPLYPIVRKINRYFKKAPGTYKELPSEFASAIKNRLDEKLNYPFIPPIAEKNSSKDSSFMGYNYQEDLMKLNSIIRKNIFEVKGFEDVALDIIEGLIPHEMAHRENKDTQKSHYYKHRANKSGKKEDIEIFYKYRRLLEERADIEGCINGGLSTCHKLIIFFSRFPKYTTLTGKTTTIDMYTEDEYEHDSDTHPATKKRFDYLTELVDDMEQEDQGKCFNPFHNLNDLPRWFDCNNKQHNTEADDEAAAL